MYRIFTPAWLIFCVITIPGCNILFPSDGQRASSNLKTFSSQEEMEEYFQSQLGSRNEQFLSLDRIAIAEGGATASDEVAFTGGAGDGDAVSSPPSEQSPSVAEDADSDDGSSFSGTTTQEVGVDEADVVKNDGEYLYIIDDSTVSGSGSVLRIVRAYPPESLEVVGELELEGYGRNIYLLDDKIVALTATYGQYFAMPVEGPVFIDDDNVVIAIGGSVSGESSGDSGVSDGSAGSGEDGITVDPADALTDEDAITLNDSEEVKPDEPIEIPLIEPEYQYERPRTKVSVIDVSDRSAPRQLSLTAFDGTPVSSRMIDGVLHVVVANYQGYYYDVIPLLGRTDLDTESVAAEEFLPTFEQTDADGNSTSGSLLDWQQMYRPEDPDGFGVVSLVSLDVANDAEFSAVGVVAEPGLIYSSTEALYLTNTDYDFQGDRRTFTSIYKFAYQEKGAVPVATGSVSGRVLNQYSMSEYKGFLRLASTVDRTFLFGGVTESYNNVYVLGQTGEGLEVVGSVENLAPGQTIQSARFLGDRGYVVTFEQRDPLYTLDLTVPTNPLKIGEWHGPGFSTFIVPMDENHLLTVGQYVPEEGPGWIRGVQLAIFDVTDFANPIQEDLVILGEESGSAWSEALSDPKAFNYFKDRSLVALPVTIDGGFGIEPFLNDVVIGGIEGEVEIIDSGDDPVDAPPPPDEGDEGMGVAESPYPPPFEGVVVYDVSVEGGIKERGRINTTFDSQNGGYWWWTSFTRGVFIEDAVFAVTNQGVRGAMLDDVNTAPFEVFYGQIPEIEVPVLPVEVLPIEVDPLIEIDQTFFDEEGASSGGGE